MPSCMGTQQIFNINATYISAQVHITINNNNNNITTTRTLFTSWQSNFKNSLHLCNEYSMAPTATNVWSKSPGSHYPSNIHSNCPDTSVAKIPHSPPLYFSSFPVTTKFSRPHLLMTWPRKLSCLWRTVAQCSIQHNQLSMTRKKQKKAKTAIEIL